MRSMPSPPLTVLLTNLFVANNTGSETVTELYADGLRRAGHRPIIYAHHLGPQADRMRARGHRLIDRLSALPERPDIIHAQHGPTAMAAIAALPGMPAIFLCHSAQFEVEAPPAHPQIRHVIAVDELCRDRCLARGVPPSLISMELNPIDPERLHLRGPLPARPARALLLTKNLGHQRAIRAACEAAGIALEELGPASGRVSASLEAELPRFDLVFATARMALEAAATGCAVIVCDARGFAGLLTEARLEAWRRLNFGAGLLARPVTETAVAEALAAYDPGDAGRVAARLRAEARLEDCIDRLVARYREAMAEPPPTSAEAAAALAAWMEDNVPSAEPRNWMTVAREMHGLEGTSFELAVRAAEDRLAREMEAGFARLGDGVVSAQVAEARLFQAMESGSVQWREELGVTAAQHHLQLEERIAGLERQLAEAVDRLSAPGRIERLVRSTYRRVVPLSLRRPLHDLRRSFTERDGRP
ncbi:glycosyltransferase [Roseococcus pinisoli]|uniref:Glycosyltransferase family 4 protein n=1 Tax=Roseococcus pinisoli TaxID=2835040 RepID=A0ABS5QK16_9PROT|nr:glycosyltransferase [Roseococcus pinisoli]MBS7813245.1 glycosyltransferase family 4 protein [Roseococcus pinisoli]